MWEKAQQQRETGIKAAPSEGDKAKSMGHDSAGNPEITTKLFVHPRKQRRALLIHNRRHLHKLANL